jgi:hypothetical protein
MEEPRALTDEGLDNTLTPTNQVVDKSPISIKIVSNSPPHAIEYLCPDWVYCPGSKVQ